MFYNFINNLLLNFFSYINKYDFSTQLNPAYEATHSYMASKNVIQGRDLLVFVIFGIIALVFIIFLIFVYFKEKKKPRY